MLLLTKRIFKRVSLFLDKLRDWS